MLPRILIAEDNALQSAVLRAVLQGRGYEADVVTDGLEAVRQLRTGSYDLALLDYHMPEVDGLAAARLLQDFLGKGNMPRLIGVTVAAEELCDKQEACGGGVFDAVVSKGLGFASLLNTIDTNLVTVANIKAAQLVERERAESSERAVTRRRQGRAPLAALPGLAMASVFALGAGWAVMSLNAVDTSAASSERTAMLGINTSLLVGAMQDTDTSQLAYLASPSDAHWQRFETNSQRVDQLLISPASLAADGTLGAGDAALPQTLVENRLQALTQEALVVRNAGPTVVPPAQLAAADEAGSARLRDWALSLVSLSQRAVVAGLDAARHNVQLVLGVLGIGVLYGLTNAAFAVGRRWRGPHGVAGREAGRPSAAGIPLRLSPIPIVAPRQIRGQYGLRS